MMTVVLIDDEALARQRLSRLLLPHQNEITIVGEAANGSEGREVIERLRPDLIFLDIEMPVMNGFEMLKQLQHIPKIIFTTAYDSFAIKAFEQNSVDYLLKPVEQERLDKAIAKLNRLSRPVTDNLYDQIREAFDKLNAKKDFKALPVRVGDKTLFIKPEDITHFEASEKYVNLYLANGTNYVLDESLNTLEKLLPQKFLRINRAIIINTDFVKEMHRGFNSTQVFVLNNASHLRLRSGRSYNDSIKSFFNLK